MPRIANFTRIGALAVGAGALALLGAAPATAVPTDEDVLYTAVFAETDDELATSGFATISQTDATETPFDPTLPEGLFVTAVEAYDGVGYALVGEATSEGQDPGFFIMTWDLTTGEPGTPVPLSSDGAIRNAWGLDTVENGDVADGTLLLIVEDEEGAEWVASVDPLTGTVTPLVDVSGEGVPEYIDSIATDSTTGITYLMVDEDDGMPQYLELDLAAGTWTGPVDLGGVNSAIGNGYMAGTDFDADGVLWFYYNVEDGQEGGRELLASTTGAFGAAVSATVVGEVDETVSSGSLAIGGPVAETPVEEEPDEPELAETGGEAGGLLIGGGVMLLAGAAVVLATRRSRTV